MGSSKTLPFHESILRVIPEASGAELELLAKLLQATTIPRGHGLIVEAWENRCKQMCFPEDYMSRVSRAVREQSPHPETD